MVALKYTAYYGAEYPAPADVRDGIQYGDAGTEFTGTLDDPADNVYPDPSDVRIGVTYGTTGSDQTGTLDNPADNVYPDPADVRIGVEYGTDGDDQVGTLEPLTRGASQTIRVALGHDGPVSMTPLDASNTPLDYSGLTLRLQVRDHRHVLVRDYADGEMTRLPAGELQVDIAPAETAKRRTLRWTLYEVTAGNVELADGFFAID